MPDLVSAIAQPRREGPVADGDLPIARDPRLVLRWAVAGLAALSIAVVLLTAGAHLGPGITYADVGALCVALAVFSIAALWVPWHRLGQHWQLLLVGVPAVFVAAVNSLTGAGQSPYFVMYAPLLAVGGWYLSTRQTAAFIGLVVGTELWRATALDHSGSIDHLIIGLPFAVAIAATAALTSRHLREALTQMRRDQVRLAGALDAVRAFGSDGQLPVLAQLERSARALFAAEATAIVVGAERPQAVELRAAIVEPGSATLVVPGRHRVHALLRVEAREPLTAQDVRLLAILAEAAGRTLDSDTAAGSSAPGVRT